MQTKIDHMPYLDHQHITYRSCSLQGFFLSQILPNISAKLFINRSMHEPDNFCAEFPEHEDAPRHFDMLWRSHIKRIYPCAH